jgi:BirA family biotin operon repressor/biotin-[acetyl-CoA-carboxylase] ligase
VPPSPSPSRFSDLERPPLTRVRAEPWREVRVFAQVDSTNVVVAGSARSGEAEGLVVVADHQSGGRGRLGRTWEQPPRAGLALSVLLRPGGTPADWGWLPLAAGLAVCGALDEVAGVRAMLKWPNDVLVADPLVGERKIAGILCEALDGALVVGIGLNVSTRADELPEGATSLALCGSGPVDRATVLRSVLRALHGAYQLWRQGGPDLRQAYLQRSATLHRAVTVHQPGGVQVRGTVTDIDLQGRLVVDGTAYAAGDVVHLR